MRLWATIAAASVVAAMTGLGVGYLIWGWPTNWYTADVNRLGPGAENDLIRYGHALVVDTPQHIDKSASDPAMRFGGNDLACQSCHLNAGLQPFAAPFVSTFATFPMLIDDQVLTLKERINGCMTRSMNGKPLPDEGREMQALIAYIKFVGQGTPEGVRVPGMGSSLCVHPPIHRMPPAAKRSMPSSAPIATRPTGKGRGACSRMSATPSRRSGATTASMKARAWPSSTTLPPISTTCRSASITRIRF